MSFSHVKSVILNWTLKNLGPNLHFLGPYINECKFTAHFGASLISIKDKSNVSHHRLYKLYIRIFVSSFCNVIKSFRCSRASKKIATSLSVSKKKGSSFYRLGPGFSRLFYKAWPRPGFRLTRPRLFCASLRDYMGTFQLYLQPVFRIPRWGQGAFLGKDSIVRGMHVARPTHADLIPNILLAVSKNRTEKPKKTE